MSFNVKKIVLSSFLTGVLMLPYWGSFYHLFEDHNHTSCEISETHLHEIVLDCNVLDYHFAPSIEISYPFESLVVPLAHQKKITAYYLRYSFSVDPLELLRGPPAA